VLCAVAPVGDHLAALDAAERAVVARAVAKRQREFATGRSLAHRLLEQLGAVGAPLLPGPDRAPLWPAGVVGSIAHTNTLCVVAAAPAARVTGLGLDIEADTPLDEELWATVLRSDERRTLDGLPDGERGRRAKLVFCAKEATYKAVSHELGRVLEFDEVSIDVDPAGSFAARVLEDEPRGGRWLVADGVLLAVMVLRV